MNSNFKLQWECGTADIFANYKIADNVEIADDYIAVLDWCGYKHYYNRNGEFNRVYLPEYDCNK